MERHFDEELASLKARLLDMCSLAETMISESVRVLVDRSGDLAENIYEQEKHMDQLQLQIDEACCRLLALYQPAASDLRFLLGVAKINSEVEGLGDKAVHITKIAMQLMTGSPLKPFEMIPPMVAIATEMVKESLHAFVNLDVLRAQSVIQRDDELDRLNTEIGAHIIQMMEQDTNVVAAGIKLIFLARNLERIGDHASNIAQDVIFVAEGKDIRHQDGLQP